MLDAGLVDGRAYLLSELVLGKSVAAIIAREQKVPFAIAVRILADVLGALAWLHERPRVHGAVTPGNVIVTYGGAAKLSDAGVAAAVISESPNIDRRLVVFDAERLAPEVLSGRPPSESGDVYGLASTFEELADPSNTPLAALVAGMRSVDPAARPSTARAALEALSKIALGEHAPASRVAVGRWLSELFAREKSDELAEVEALRSSIDDDTDLPTFAVSEDDPTAASWTKRAPSDPFPADVETTTSSNRIPVTEALDTIVVGALSGADLEGLTSHPTSIAVSERSPGFTEEATADDLEPTHTRPMAGANFYAARLHLTSLPDVDAPPPAMPRFATVPPLDGPRTPVAPMVVPRGPNVRTMVLEDEDEGSKTPLASPPDPGAVPTFGPYALIERLGQGGMAEIFVAERRTEGGVMARCVIKRIAPALRSDRDFREMFIDESRIARMIHHPNIVECFDSGAIDGAAYMALELVDGLELGALTQRLLPHRLGIGAALEIAVALAGALDHAHHLTDEDGRPLELVHRDVSPENVMISWTGEVKLLDFGISRFRDRGYATQIGVRKGKLGYMAPEYVEGGAVDARADLFQLGVTLVEILSGKRLFAADQPRPKDLEAMRAALGRHLAASEALPPELFELLVHLCAPDPEDRPATAGEAADVLERIAEHSSPSPSLADVVQRLAPTGRARAERSDPQKTQITARPPSTPMLLIAIGLLAVSALGLLAYVILGR
jgi:serine/threonine-protein kinase